MNLPLQMAAVLRHRPARKRLNARIRCLASYLPGGRSTSAQADSLSVCALGTTPTMHVARPGNATILASTTCLGVSSWASCISSVYQLRRVGNEPAASNDCSFARPQLAVKTADLLFPRTSGPSQATCDNGATPFSCANNPEYVCCTCHSKHKCVGGKPKCVLT